MKKGISAIIILCLIVIGVGALFILQKQFRTTPQQQQLLIETTSPAVSVTIFDGVTTATYSGIQALTPYEALTKIASQQQISVQTKQYDFGVFVEAIAGKENTKDKTWIYFVNGKSGEVAADKYTLKQNDTVEWNYITPIY
jgi:heme/copper-type cytochrome/quinol oxidase subunit 2